MAGKLVRRATWPAPFGRGTTWRPDGQSFAPAASRARRGRPLHSGGVGELDPPMERALELGWESFRTGSLGVGATVTRHGEMVATGQNRPAEQSRAWPRIRCSAVSQST